MRETTQGPVSTPGPATQPDTGHATTSSLTAGTDNGRGGPAMRKRSAPTHRWARLIAARYGLSLPEARTELRRLAAGGWQTWEFHTRFNDRKDTTA